MYSSQQVNERKKEPSYLPYRQSINGWLLSMGVSPPMGEFKLQGYYVRDAMDW